MEKFTFDSDVQGNHVCKDDWKPTIGEILHPQHELDNEVDKFAVTIYLCEYSRILTYLMASSGENWKQRCGGMGIPCRLVFSSSTKVKINRLKELLKSKICQ